MNSRGSLLVAMNVEIIGKLLGEIWGELKFQENLLLVLFAIPTSKECYQDNRIIFDCKGLFSKFLEPNGKLRCHFFEMFFGCR